MKCRYCGYEIPDNELYCRRCGKEVRIVPDYNPLDEVLAAQIRGAIEGTDSPLDDYEYEHGNRNQSAQAGRRTSTGNRTSAGRGTNPGSRTSTGRRGSSGCRTGTGRHTAPGARTGTDRMPGNTPEERKQRRRQAEKKKALKKKKRLRAFIILAVAAAAAAIAGVVIYQTSYTGQVNKGNKALEEKNYDKATAYFEKAAGKKPKKAEAYTGLSKVYLAKDQADKAEDTFLKAIESYPKEAVLYEACVQFYVDTKQATEVSVLLDEAPGAVRTELKAYVSDAPKYSLDASKTYDDVQELSLKTSGKSIYYTIDGTDPTTSSQKYTEPIQLEEGETTIKAIAVNKKGIPSLQAEKTYKIELPVEDAPAVSPSTGQYEESMQIVIQVPEGYEAYYTLDKSDPTTDSEKYTGPIEMPSGETIFKAILINAKGRVSGITTRNYELSLE